MWMTVRSWMFVSSPMRTGIKSARMTQPNQTLARAPTSTSPMTSALSATHAPCDSFGVLPRKVCSMETSGFLAQVRIRRGGAGRRSGAFRQRTEPLGVAAVDALERVRERVDFLGQVVEALPQACAG